MPLVFFDPLQLASGELIIRYFNIFQRRLNISQLWVDSQAVIEQFFKLHGFGWHFLAQAIFAGMLICVFGFYGLFRFQIVEFFLDWVGLLDFIEVSVDVEPNSFDGRVGCLGLKAGLFW